MRNEILGILQPKTAQRFRAKLQRQGECLVFIGCRHKNGYGVIEVMIEGRRYPILTHRLAWALEHGIDPPPELGVLHSCNNPPCCELTHLRFGTQLDNAADMIAAGRRPPPPMLGRTGTSHPRSHPQEMRDQVIAAIEADLAAGKGTNFTRAVRGTTINRDTAARWWSERPR